MPHCHLSTPRERNRYETYEEYNVPPAENTGTSVRRTKGKRAKEAEHRCRSMIVLFLFHKTGNWYLSDDTCLHHCHHAPLPPKFRDVGQNKLLPIEVDFVQLLLDQGVSNQNTANILTTLRQRQGLLGVIRKQTLDNLTASVEGDINFLTGVSHKWSVAEKTLNKLERMKVSWCALVMDKHDNLIVYRGKGRPSKSDSESVRINGDLKRELNRVRNALKLGKGDNILLALSVATDEMIRSMQMHPEVQFFDVMANVNKQKRDMFLSVLKAASGGCFIGNLTILPCQQRWIFLKIYQTFFLYLYGKDTISKIRLVLTDDDEASHSAFDTCRILVDSWTLCLHMLCIFHGLVMKFHKLVWPKLPHRKDNAQLLTPLGKIYSE